MLGRLARSLLSDDRGDRALVGAVHTPDAQRG
jgi:hypothetical protein